MLSYISRLWFGFRLPVNRRAYLLTGLSLMLIKYLAECLILYLGAGQTLSPAAFLLPTVSARVSLLSPATEWMAYLWIGLSLPFLWVAISMSARRAQHAGWSPMICLLLFAPVVNLFAMLLLAALPATTVARPQPVFGSTPETAEEHPPYHCLRSLFFGLSISGILGVGLTLLCVNVLQGYGMALFIGTPVMVGACCSYILVRFGNAHYSGTSCALFGALGVLCCGLITFLFAMEGAICLVMAAPIALPLGMVGGALGCFFAVPEPIKRSSVVSGLLFVPLWGGVETVLPLAQQEFLVTTSIDIEAPIEEVWEKVIHFPDMPEPTELIFRVGIACPMRATIDGEGVGAVRRCIFTTGTFVEPITTWDAPTHLAFDVKEQPAPMFELSPYAHVHPPHLDNALRSKRGEFLLQDLGDGRTRLTGNTWYEFDMFPRPYWRLWSDGMIHAIHQRVLAHIKQLAEG